jgi:putative PIN family toxin of toxin-antitoxin system
VIRVVLDANVLAPAFINPNAAAGRLVTAWQRDAFELIVSEPLLAELIRTYQDSYYAQRVSSELVDAAITLLRRRAILIDLTALVEGVATHPEDDLLLSAVSSGAADYLATRDRQLLKLGNYQGARILHPADLADRLEQETRRSTPGD